MFTSWRSCRRALGDAETVPAATGWFDGRASGSMPPRGGRTSPEACRLQRLVGSLVSHARYRGLGAKGEKYFGKLSAIAPSFHRVSQERIACGAVGGSQRNPGTAGLPDGDRPGSFDLPPFGADEANAFGSSAMDRCNLAASVSSHKPRRRHAIPLDQN